MKLEGIDPRHPQLYTVLSVAEVKGFRLRLHFDGYSECYDFWVNANNPFLFPAGWAEKNGKPLQPPKGESSTHFSVQINVSLACNSFRGMSMVELVDKKAEVFRCSTKN